MDEEEYTTPEDIKGRVVRKWELAEKVWSGQRLTVKDKKDIYTFLTGNNHYIPLWL